MKYSFLSDIGKVRKVNEDSVGIFKNHHIVLGMVADGIGGNHGGDVASAMVIQHLGYLFEESDCKNLEEAYRWLQEQVQYENDLLIEKGKRYTDLEGMGTTLVCCLLNNKKCVIANIGDSRGYLFRNHKLKQLSYDHSLVNELIKEGAITKEEAITHPQKNVIIKALGINHEAQMDMSSLKIQTGDIFLLCSDGLSKQVSEFKIQSILKKDELLKDKCRQLIDQARINGGDDNITALLVAVDESGELKCE